MTAWDIQLTEVASVLNAVFDRIGEEGQSDTLVASMYWLSDHLGDCAEASASFPVQTALYEFAEHYLDELGGAAAKTVSAVNGAGEAAIAYDEGQEDMALQHQQAAGHVPEPVDPYASLDPTVPR